MMDSSNLKRLMRIHEPKLKFLSCCIDQIVLWARETLDSTANEMRRWLRSPRLKEADQRPFKVRQEQTTVKRYVGHWKQFTLFFALAYSTTTHVRNFMESSLPLSKET